MERNLALKAALRKWADDRGLTPADFARATGYSYNHAYQLLKGEMPVTDATVGRLVMVWGAAVATEMGIVAHQEAANG